MALSGSISKNVGSHWQLKLSWTATQDIDANTSRVTAKMYWIAKDSYGAISSSATKTSAIQFNNGSWITDSASGKAKLSANQTKLIQTESFTVKHSSDGKGSFSLDGYFDAEVTLGSWVGRIDLDQQTFTLNTIPRASSISSSVSFTAGNDLKVSISRASGSFTHDLSLKVNGTTIKSVSDVGTSYTFSFSSAENAKIFTELAQGTSKAVRVDITTKNGSSTVGTGSKSGTVTAPDSATTSFGGNFNIGDTMSGTVKTNNSAFRHKIVLIFGGTTYTIKDNIAAGDWSYSTSAIASALYAKIPDANSIKGEIRIYTYYSGVQVRSYHSSTLTAYVVNSKPTFSGGFTYADISAVPSGITKTNQQIIQNYSNVRVTLPAAAKATALNGASMKSYICILNGKQVSLSYSTSDLVFDMGKVTAGVNVNLSIRAIDSRGNYTEVVKVVTVIPYIVPSLSYSGKRLNNFENQTDIKLSGSYSAAIVGNTLLEVKYRFKKSNATAWGAYSNFTYTTASGKFSATTAQVDLDNTETFDIELYVRDRLGTSIAVMAVASGQPIFYVDSKNRGVGINKFPTKNKSLEVGGGKGVYVDGGYFELEAYNDSYGKGKGFAQMFYDANNSRLKLQSRDTSNVLSNLQLTVGSIEVAADQWYSKGGGLNLNNSDVMGANGIFFRDTNDSSGEGLLFPKSGAPVNSVNVADYDQLFVLNGTGFINDEKIATSGNVFIDNGYVVISPKGDNEPTSVSVKFGRKFPKAPSVVVTPSTTVPGKTVTGWAATDVTTDGFTLWVTRTNTTNTALHWVAAWGI